MAQSDAVAQARALMQEGKDKDAARLLTDAATDCRDPEEARSIRALAEEGREHAGRFSKGRWDEIIRIADKHAAAAS